MNMMQCTCYLTKKFQNFLQYKLEDITGVKKNLKMLMAKLDTGFEITKKITVVEIYSSIKNISITVIFIVILNPWISMFREVK